MKADTIWTVTEINPRTLVRRRVKQTKNLFTNYGLAALAQAISGIYAAPLFLAMNSDKGTLVASYAPGVSTISTTAIISQGGDTQLILGLGTVNQEIIGFSSYSGSGPYAYILTSPTTKTHALGDICYRQVTQGDLIYSVTTPIQYDTVGAPGLWPGATSGYAVGQAWIQQWYLTSVQAVSYITAVGMCDSPTIGGGNLHDHLILGYDHTAGTQDVEIDVSLTLTN